MKPNGLRKRFQFFLANAGYATPPGRAACALGLAKAEAYAEDHEWSFEWVFDDDADLSWMDEAERKLDHEVLGCVVKDADGEVLASLWSIVDPDASYRRVVEAELSSEAMHQEIEAQRAMRL
jgi:hypothetical protein